MGLTLCQQDAMHNDALLSQRLHARLLVKKKRENNKTHAPGFEFVVGTALSSTDCEGSPLLSRTSQAAFSFKKYCHYQRSVLSWIECVRHGSTQTTISFSIPTPIVSLLFLLESCRYDASFRMLRKNIKHELCLHGRMVLKKTKTGVRGPSVCACPNLVVSIM